MTLWHTLLVILHRHILYHRMKLHQKWTIVVLNFFCNLSKFWMFYTQKSIENCLSISHHPLLSMCSFYFLFFCILGVHQSQPEIICRGSLNSTVLGTLQPGNSATQITLFALSISDNLWELWLIGFPTGSVSHSHLHCVIAPQPPIWGIDNDTEAT